MLCDVVRMSSRRVGRTFVLQSGGVHLFQQVAQRVHVAFSGDGTKEFLDERPVAHRL